MIEVKGLTKKFGTLLAVNQIDFSIDTGQTLALVGTSGCGKTTTLKMINRLIEPTSGEIYVNEENVMDISATEMRRRIGYVIQDMGLFPHYTVEENIAIVPHLLKWDEKKVKKRGYELMKKLGLDPEEYASKFPDQLSGGQQQRVGIARALAANPPIILMDEPFGALDPVTRRKIRKEFKELEELASKTAIIITHDIEEAFELADLVLVLHEGELQQLGTPKELLFKPANEFVVKFLAEQRLQLEFEVVSLKDIFDEVENMKPQGEIQYIHMDPREKILSVITHMTKSKTSEVFVSVQVNGEKKVFDLPALMDAFYHITN